MTEQRKPADIFAELNSMIAKGLLVQAAKSSRSNKRRSLTAEQQELLQEVDQHEEVERWVPVAAIAHFVEQVCACGQKHTYFNSWYLLSVHKNHAGEKKMIRQAQVPEGEFNQHEHWTCASTAVCQDCIQIQTSGEVPAQVQALLQELGLPLTASSASGESRSSERNEE